MVVSTLIEAGGFDVSAAGYVASAEVFGIALANAATTFGAVRMSWRLLCGIGLAQVLTGSALSLLAGASPPAMMSARAVSGLGSGLLISRGYAAAGLTRDPDRMLDYILATSTAQTAIVSYCLPILAASWGVPVIFDYFATLAAFGVLFLKRIPVGADAAILSSHSGSILAERVAALVAAASLFLGLGVLWAYLFQIGLAVGATTGEAAAVTLPTLRFAFSPAIAARIVSSDDFRMAQFLCIALLVVSAAAPFAAFVLSQRRTGATGIASRPPPGPRHEHEF